MPAHSLGSSWADIRATVQQISGPFLGLVRMVGPIHLESYRHIGAGAGVKEPLLAPIEQIWAVLFQGRVHWKKAAVLEKKQYAVWFEPLIIFGSPFVYSLGYTVAVLQRR